MTKPEKPTGLDLLREPFPAHLIGQLPKPTKWQTDEVKADYRKGILCQICGQRHHPKVVHLDYVGHAALTDRLLDCDINWNWEPMGVTEAGLPAIVNGGLWIRLTVCGQSRLGFGDAEGKQGGNAIKELIGDALRNAAMRFGAALDLWHKGDLNEKAEAEVTDEKPKSDISPEQFVALRDIVESTGSDEKRLLKHFSATNLEQFPPDKYEAAMKMLRAKLTTTQQPDNADLSGDKIPY